MNPTVPLRLGEFIALMAMIFAMVAFSIDSMLPALPRIAADLTPDDVNRAQLVLTSFVLGMGLGSFFAGPLSDALGRKGVIVCGIGLYAVGALLASLAGSLEMLLAARVLQGLGVAGPRIVSMALVRDLYQGRQMARVMSFAMMIFILVPAIAPALGTVIIAHAGWRGLFFSFILFGLVAGLWLMLRQPETLPPDKRKPLGVATLWAALREVTGNRTVVLATLALTLGYGMLFGTLSSIQQIFADGFGRGDSFPFWFAGIAICSGGASFVNAQLVVRLGMRAMVRVSLAAQAIVSVGFSGLWFGGFLPEWLMFPLFLLWATGVFFMAGLVFGNLNAIALEPMGHLAGMAASVTSSISTVLAVAIAAPIGLAFDGTPLPLTVGVAVLAVVGWGLMRAMPAASGR